MPGTNLDASLGTVKILMSHTDNIPAFMGFTSGLGTGLGSKLRKQIRKLISESGECYEGNKGGVT